MQVLELQLLITTTCRLKTTLSRYQTLRDLECLQVQVLDTLALMLV
jgi:hypothetical protein